MSVEKTQYKNPFTSFCEQHELHPAFLHIPRRSINEWETLRFVQEIINNAHPLQQTLSFWNTPISPESELVRIYLWASGSYPVTQNSSPKWANPHYEHGHEHQDVRDPRRTHVEKAIATPTIKRETIATRFGIKPKALTKWMNRRDMRFRERRTETKKQIARSIRTTVKWSDYHLAELRRIMPVSEYTVETWLYDLLEDFTAPDKPIHATWF